MWLTFGATSSSEEFSSHSVYSIAYGEFVGGKSMESHSTMTATTRCPNHKYAETHRFSELRWSCPPTFHTLS